MLGRIIIWSLNNRLFVLGLAAVIVVVGVISVNRMNFDAFPDTTPVQVQINTQVQALVPEEIETLVTFPIELSILALPGLEQVRSISMFGLSQVVATFRDGTDIYFARQLISQRIANLPMPPGIEPPQMGPVATGLGEVFHYFLDSSRRDLTDLRTFHDWEVKPIMRQTPGTAEINSWGGYEKQHQVRIDPLRLIKYDLSFDQVVDAVAKNNLNVGGGKINRDHAGEMLLVQGVGRTVNTEQIQNIVITSKDGVPIRIRDVAHVGIGHEIRKGLVTANGEGEVVLGLGFMLMGENSYRVTHAMKQKMNNAKETLAAVKDGDVDVHVVYDRTELVDKVIGTVKRNLIDAALLVVTVLYVMIGNLRAGLIVASAIPISMLCGFTGMLQAGIAGTLLSLGAIDFGVVVESNVIVVENIVRRLAHAPLSRSKLEVVRDAAVEVRQPAVFGQLVIMIVYVPLLTLEGAEGKMFRPMAWTLMFLLMGSLMCSLTLIPVLASYFLPRTIDESDPWIVRLAKWMYRPILSWSLRWPYVAIGVGVAGLALTVKIAMGLGTEFVPRLSEGAIVIGVTRAPGTDLDESVRINAAFENLLVENFPDEIANIWTRTGAPEVATDPSGVESSDVFITLHPREHWTKTKSDGTVCQSQDDIVDLMEDVAAQVPGQILWFTQPIEQRINEMSSGVRSDIALKLFGPDFDVLISKARELESILRGIKGSVDLVTEQISGQPVLQVRIKQDQVARYGIPAKQVLDLVESIGSKPLGTIIEGQLRFPLAVRLPEEYRTNPEAVKSILVATPSGERIPLSRLADVTVGLGPRMISREWSERRITVMCNVRGRDIGSFVAEAQAKIDQAVELPEGYRITWGGQFENMQRAQRRLGIVVPLALVLIVVLLYSTYHTVTDTAFVFTSVPFACVGGIMALSLRGMPLSISASVGFITLAGVSVLNNMVVVTAIRQNQLRGMDNYNAIRDAAMERLRTRMMTAMVAIFGFLPMATSSGVGAEVQRPLATVVIGGVVSSTIMTLFVLPALYLLVPPARREALGPGDDPHHTLVVAH